MAFEQVGEGVRTLGMVIDVGGGAQVSRILEGPENSGGSSTRDRSCVHFPKHHACGFEEAEGCVNGEEFAGWAGSESIYALYMLNLSVPQYREYPGSLDSSSVPFAVDGKDFCSWSLGMR